MIKIFVINGTGGVGKDTFVNFCQEYVYTLQEPVYVQNYSTIEPIKRLAREVGWDGGKTSKDRKFLSDLKDLLTEYNDYPYQYIKYIISNQPSKFDYIKIIFIHCREPKEIQRFVDDYNAETILIRRQQIKPADNHADMEVEDFNYNYIIDNNGSIKELKVKAENFVNNIIKEKD